MQRREAAATAMDAQAVLQKQLASQKASLASLKAQKAALIRNGSGTTPVSLQK